MITEQNCHEKDKIKKELFRKSYVLTYGEKGVVLTDEDVDNKLPKGSIVGLYFDSKGYMLWVKMNSKDFLLSTDIEVLKEPNTYDDYPCDTLCLVNDGFEVKAEFNDQNPISECTKGTVIISECVGDRIPDSFI